MMLVRCTGCNTAYKISDQRVPPGGVKVRCPKCRVIFTVKPEVEKEPETLGEKLFGKDVVRRSLLEESPKPGVEDKICERKPETAEEDKGAPEKPASREQQAAREGAQGVEPKAAGERARETEPEAAGEGARVSGSAEKSETEAARETVREMVRETVTQPVTPPTPPCGPTQPEPAAFPFEAKREDPRTLARALISDVLFYNREKRDKGLAEGKVLAYLSREIARSWELYKERVGVEKAIETDHFREAVNDILGEGKKIL